MKLTSGSFVSESLGAAGGVTLADDEELTDWLLSCPTSSGLSRSNGGQSDESLVADGLVHG